MLVPLCFRLFYFKDGKVFSPRCFFFLFYFIFKSPAIKVLKFAPDCFCPFICEELVIKETRDLVTELRKQAQFYNLCVQTRSFALLFLF